MLFRRFALVTTSIALMGILLSNLIESTQTRSGGFAIEQRLIEWQVHDARKACEQNINLCFMSAQLTLTI